MGSKRKRRAKENSNGSLPAQKRTKNSHQPDASNDDATQLELDKSPFLEKPTSEQRIREAKTYDLLGSPIEVERIAAADALITGLLGGEGVPEAVLLRHLDKRLFRGLASSRNASRVGFSLVITELLRELFGEKNLAAAKYPGLSFNKVLEILIENTTASGNIPGQEERDFYFGQLFGLQCFVEAKVLFGKDSRWTTVLDLLLKLAEKKAWLRSQCGWVIVEALTPMGQAGAEATLQQLSEMGLGKTAEGVGIWLTASDLYPRMKFPAKPWKNPLSPKSLPELANVLKENVKNDTNQEATALKMKQGSPSSSQLHFVWDVILAYFLKLDDSDSAANAEQFKLFWNTVVDDGLFSKSASEGQKFRGFLIFQKFLPHVVEKDGKLYTELFSKNLMKCLINQTAKEDRYLHRAALKSLKSVEQTVEKQPEMLTATLNEILGKRGAYDFDQRTSTKLVERLLQFSTSKDVDAVLKLLRKPVVVLKESDAGEVEKIRQVYAEYVFRLAAQVKSGAEDQTADGKVIEVAIKELASCAYSDSESFTPSLSEKSRENFRSRLSTAFAKLTKRKEDYHYLCDAVLAIQPNAVQMSGDLTAERDLALKAMKKLLKASAKSGETKGNSSLGLALLYAISVLQLYSGDADAVEVLSDLKQCSAKMKEGDSDASLFLVEILLSLVARPSAMMRQITLQVFEAFTGTLSSEALKLLTDSLLAEENLKGQQALFNIEDDADLEEDGDGSDDEDDEEDMEEDEISEMEIGSDVEFVALDGAEPMDEDDGEEEEDDDEEDDEEDGEDQGNDADGAKFEALDDALAKVLKSHRLDQDKDAESSDNDSDMTDSEMIALDEKLVEVFKQRAKKSNNKKQGRDAKESVITFKHRVLDFLTIYVKTEALNPLAFELLLPLLEVTRSTGNKPIANKAIEIINDFSKSFKKAKGSQDNTSLNNKTQMALLKQIHAQASLDASHAFAKAASSASLLVVASVFANDKDQFPGVASLYAQSQADWVMGKVKLQAVFFSDWLNWCQGQASNA